VVVCLEVEGICLTQEWIRLLTCVETDCKRLVQALKKGEPALCKFTHVSREVNQVAHDPAQLALRHQQCMVMCFNAPPGIMYLVEDTPVANSSNHCCNNFPS
jgi:hypothetical protein